MNNTIKTINTNVEDNLINSRIYYRDINHVIKRIKDQVPKKWDMRIQFFDAIEIMMESTRWTAPEIYNIRFEKLAVILEDYLSRPEEEWKQYIWKIFNDEMK